MRAKRAKTKMSALPGRRVPRIERVRETLTAMVEASKNKRRGRQLSTRLILYHSREERVKKLRDSHCDGRSAEEMV